MSVVRPFNTYGPFQRSVGEGGVVAIFTRRSLLGEELRIYGDGTQTRDLLYAEDCARFVCDALASDAAVGRILNAGTGEDVSVNALAAAIEPDAARIRHVEHIHPQSEIAVLRCDPRLAADLLGWRPAVALEEGLARTRTWMAARLDGGSPGRDERAPCGSRSTAATPVRSTFLPYAHQQINDDDVAAVAEVLRSDWLTTGPRVPALEAGLARSPGPGTRSPSRRARPRSMEPRSPPGSGRATRPSPRR